VENIDLVLYDLKHPDSGKHREKTGVGNELILDNAAKIAARKATWFRIPLVPNFNDSPACMKKIIELALSFGVGKLSILPYHQWGISKYKRLGREYLFDPNAKIAEERVQDFSNRIQKEGLEVTIGA
jgi:pyruvate formate lyase activating enzyme